MKYKKELEKFKKEIIERIGKCEKCGRKENLTIDHIIPMALLLSFGTVKDKTLDAKNLQVLCMLCNQYKGDRLDFSDPRTKKLLLEFVSEIPEV